MTKDSFTGWSDSEIDHFLRSNGFTHWTRLNDGEVIGILGLLFTTSVCMGVTPQSTYKYRWCFEDPKEAHLFFSTAEDYDDIPTERSSLRGHRYITSPLLIEYDQLGLPKW